MRSLFKSEDTIADIQNWIHPFQEITFPTVIIPLSKELGVIYLKDYRHRYYSSNTPLSSQEIQAFHQLRDEIDSTIQHFQSPCFIRLTTRSPKDAVMIPWNDLQLLKNSSQLTINQKLIQYFELLTQQLQVMDGHQGMKLLQESERIFLDVQQAYDASSPPPSSLPDDRDLAHHEEEATPSKYCPWDMGICIRKWDHRINEKYEFRCFIFQNHLVAISQYNTFIFCEELLRDKETLQSLILKFYHLHIFPILQHTNTSPTNCILDLGIFLPLPTLSEIAAESSLSFYLNHLVVIELNPYNRRTGGGCFHWEYDSKILFPVDEVPVSVVFRLVGEGSSDGTWSESDEKGGDPFQMSEFTKRQENIFEGLLSEYEREEYLANHHQQQQQLVEGGEGGKEDQEGRNISRCLVM
jgi:hypothetical protein